MREAWGPGGLRTAISCQPRSLFGGVRGRSRRRRQSTPVLPPAVWPAVRGRPAVGTVSGGHRGGAGSQGGEGGRCAPDSPTPRWQVPRDAVGRRWAAEGQWVVGTLTVGSVRPCPPRGGTRPWEGHPRVGPAAPPGPAPRHLCLSAPNRAQCVSPAGDGNGLNQGLFSCPSLKNMP